MKPVMVLLLALFLVPLASATQIHHGWHYSEETFAIKGVNHEVFHEYGEDNVFISTDSSSFLLSLNKCVEKGQWEYCVTDIEQNISSDRVKYKDGDAYAGIKIMISELKPSVSIKRSFSKTNPALEEYITVTVTIENNGNRPIDRYEYRDTYPPELKVRELGPEGNSYYKQGSLGVNQKQTFQYSIKAEDFTDYVSQGILNYTYGEIKETLKSSSQKIEVEKPYEIEFDIEDSKLQVGEETIVDVKITNFEDELDATLNLDLDGLEVLSTKGNLTESRGVYTWTGLMEKDDEVEFQLKVTPPKTGTYDVSLEGDFDVVEESYSYSDTKKLTAELKGLQATLEVTPSEVNSEANVRIRAYLKNEGLVQMEGKEMKVTVFGKDYGVLDQFIQPGNTELIFERHVKAPTVKSTTREDVSFEGKYYASGEGFDFSKEQTLKVHPKPKVLSIEMTAPKSAVKEHVFPVEVKISNTGGYPFEAVLQNTYANYEKNISLNVSPGDEKTYTYNAIPSKEGELLVEAKAVLKGLEETAKTSALVQVNKTGIIQRPEKQVFTEETGIFTAIVNKVVDFVKWVFEG